MLLEPASDYPSSSSACLWSCFFFPPKIIFLYCYVSSNLSPCYSICVFFGKIKASFDRISERSRGVFIGFRKNQGEFRKWNGKLRSRITNGKKPISPAPANQTGSEDPKCPRSCFAPFKSGICFRVGEAKRKTRFRTFRFVSTTILNHFEKAFSSD